MLPRDRWSQSGRRALGLRPGRRKARGLLHLLPLCRRRCGDCLGGLGLCAWWCRGDPSGWPCDRLGGRLMVGPLARPNKNQGHGKDPQAGDSGANSEEEAGFWGQKVPRDHPGGCRPPEARQSCEQTAHQERRRTSGRPHPDGRQPVEPDQQADEPGRREDRGLGHARQGPCGAYEPRAPEAEGPDRPRGRQGGQVIEVDSHARPRVSQALTLVVPSWAATIVSPNQRRSAPDGASGRWEASGTRADSRSSRQSAHSLSWAIRRASSVTPIRPREAVEDPSGALRQVIGGARERTGEGHGQRPRNPARSRFQPRTSSALPLPPLSPLRQSA